MNRVRNTEYDQMRAEINVYVRTLREYLYPNIALQKPGIYDLKRCLEHTLLLNGLITEDELEIMEGIVEHSHIHEDPSTLSASEELKQWLSVGISNCPFPTSFSSFDFTNMRSYIDRLHAHSVISTAEKKRILQHIQRCLKPAQLAFTAVIDRSGLVVQYVDEGITETLGVPTTSWMGVKRYVDIHADDLDRAYGIMFQARDEKKKTVSVHRLRHADGHWVTVEVLVTPRINSKGEVDAFYCEFYVDTDACKKFDIEQQKNNPLI